MSRILGLDLGIASVGYAVVELDEEHFQHGKIIDSGVRIFDIAENPKNGASLAVPRREARSLRRILRRKTLRLQQIRNLFTQRHILTEKEILSLYDNPLPNVWKIRRDCLYEKQSARNVCLALLHIAKRRGFRSMRKSAEKADKETGKLLQGISQLKTLLENSKCQTIGEFLYKLPACEPKRNKEGSYAHSVARKMLEDEVHIILGKQRKLGNGIFTCDFEQDFCALAFNQNPLAPSTAGNCTFEPGEKRAAKYCYTAELFNTLCKINHIRIESNGISRALTKEERQIALDLCFEKEKNNFRQLRERLKLQEGKDFFNISYVIPSGKQKEDYDPERKTPIYSMAGYHALRKALKKHKELWEQYKNNPEGILDDIAEILSTYKSDQEIEQKLQNLPLSQKAIEELKSLSFSGFMHLSLKAMKKINPFLLEGKNYNEAAASAGYDFQARAGNKGYSKLPVLSEEENFSITSPVAKRSIAQTRKVINALNRKYGPFDAVNIELAREMGRSYEDRKDILRKQKENETERDLIKEKGIDGIIPKNAADLKKLRLWKEQDGRCIYSREYIKPERILEEGYCQADHIIPYSISFDNTLSNQVLCLTKENQDKRNDIPYDYFRRIGRNWEEFISFVENALPAMRRNKKQKLLRTKLTKEDLAGFKERNLTDTRFITSFIRNYLLANLKLTGKYKQGVFCRNGKITSDLRHVWGLSKVRGQDDKHHALDAIVLACCSNAMMQFISALYRQNRETVLLKKSEAFAKPWSTFRSDTERALSEIFVSRPPRKKVTGALHADTYYSAKHLDKGFKTLKTDINGLTLDKLKEQRELEVKYYGAQRNKNLYDAIEQALLERAEEDETPLDVRLGKNQTPVKKIRLIIEGNNGVKVLKGHAVAENGPMPRVDVFCEEGKYYLVPIYTIDFAKGKLPLMSFPDEKQMSLNNFLFSLYKDDYIEIVNKAGEHYSGYFTQYNAQTGQIYLESHDRSAIYTVSGKPSSSKKLNKNTFVSFQKYQIDVLGGIHIVTKEKYIGIRRKRSCMGG